MKEMLVVSGWGYPASVWDPVKEQLSSDYQVTVLDLFQLDEEATFPSTTSNISPYARALQRKLEALKPDVVLGWSMGGIILLEVLLSGFEYNFEPLVLATTPRFIQPAQAVFPGVENQRLRAMQIGFEATPASILADFYEFSAHPAEVRLDPERVKKIAVNNETALVRGLQYLSQVDLTAGLKNLNRLLTVLHGREDQVVPPAAGRYLADNLSHSQFEILPGGHALPSTHSQKLAERLKSLLEIG